MMKFWIFAVALSLALGSTPSWAYSEQHDEYTLDLKGFSPELVKATEAMVSRQEGRYPAPEPGRGRQFIYNLLNGEWDEPMQPWTYDRADKNFWPTKPE